MKIYAAKGWQDTGYKPGAQRKAAAWVTVRADGQWNVNVNDPARGPRDAEGRTPNSGANWYIPTDNTFPYSGEGAHGGQLIGRLGTTGAPFVVGTWCKIDPNQVDPNDTLWLTINDASSGLGDNDGALEVTIHATNLEDRDPVAEKNARIATYEKVSGKKYIPG